MSRKKSREFAFRLVFEKFFHTPNDDCLDEMEDIVLEEEDRDFVNHLIGGINQNYDSIMETIKTNTVGYELERIYKIDLAILVLAVFELKYDDTPKNVVINEAIELSKKYSTDKSYSFINGVLAKIVNEW